MDTYEVLSRFQSQTVLIVGDAILDEYLIGDCSRVSAEAPVPILRVTSSRAALGGAANAAANVVALGARAVLIAAIGDDQAGRTLATRAMSAGIHFVPVHDRRPTTRKVRVVGQQQQLLRLDYETPAPRNATVEDQALSAAREHLGSAQIVVLSDYAQGFLSERICQELIMAAHQAGRDVIVDPRPQHGGRYAGCDYITPNWREAQALLGRPEAPATEEAIIEHGRALARQMNAHVLLTLGARGMSFFNRDGREELTQPTIAKEVFDVSGAGDTVVAAFALARASGCAHHEAVTLANRAAGVVVGKFGTATVAPQELLAPADTEAKLIGRNDLPALSLTLKARGKRIVSVNGSFDVFHAGHLHILSEARRQGDVLVVGLNSDASVRSYKGPGRPIVPQEQRARILLALRCVDYVYIFDEAAPMASLEMLRPDVHVNGSEYGEDCIEADTVQKHAGRLHIVERIPGISTTELVHKIHTSGL